MKFVTYTAFILATAAAALAQGACPNLTPSSGNGGRKVGIVIDSSGSNAQTDPNNIRIVAGRALNDALYSTAEAPAAGKKADLVTVIDFDSSADVIYPLGDPSGAPSVFSSINSSGGTCIYCGVRAAINELTKAGNDPTANRTGIVVLTDGEDSSTTTLINTINNATALGIRVSFGFLSVAGDASGAQPQAVLTAILRSGGLYSSINDANAQSTFVSLVLSRGLTASDSSNGAVGALVAGLQTAAFVNPSGNVFSYRAQANERLNFTLNSVSAGNLDVVLKDAAGAELGKTTIPERKSGRIVIGSVQAAGELQLSVSASNKTADALFTVGVNSSLGVVNCTLPSSNNTTNITLPTNTTLPANTTLPTNTTGNNSTRPSTASSPPAVYTGAATALAVGERFGAFGIVAALAGGVAMLL